MDEEATELKLLVRSCVGANTTVLKASKLQHDCEELFGKQLPFRKLGFSSFVDYLKSIPSVVCLQPPNGYNPDVLPVQSENSKHVEELILRQRKPVSKGRFGPPRRRPPALRNSYVRPAISSTTPHFSNWSSNDRHLRQFTYSYSSSIMPSNTSNYPSSTRSTSTFGNVNGKSPPPPPPKGLYVSDIERHMKNNYDDTIVKESGLHTGKDLLNHENGIVKCIDDKVYPNYQGKPPGLEDTDDESNMDFDLYDDSDEDFYESISEETLSNYTIEKFSKLQSNDNASNYDSKPMRDEICENKISESMILNFQTIMAKYPGGIWASELPKKYLEIVGARLDYLDLGFTSIIDLVSNTNDVFHIKREGTHDWKLYDARLPTNNIVAPEIDLSDYCEAEKYVPNSILNEIKQLLDDHSDGFRSSFLDHLYELKYNKKLNVEALGFKKIDDFLEVLKSVIRVTKTTNYYFLQRKLKPIQLTDEGQGESLTLSETEMLQLVPNDTITPSDEIPIQELPPINPQWEENKPLIEMQVRVGEVITPANFYIILQEHYSDLDILMEEINNFYKQEEATYHIPFSYVKEGLYCAAWHVASAEWHRGKITKIDTDSQLHIEYVDYGTPAIVEKNQLRLLHKDFAKLPVQAICAKLAGIQPVNKGKRYSKKACQEFLKLVINTTLWAHVYSVNTHKTKGILQLEITLFDTNASEEIALSNVLVDKNLAEVVNKNEDILPELESEENLAEELPLWSESEQREECKPVKKPPPGFETCLPDRPGSLDLPRSCHTTPEPSIPFPIPDLAPQQANINYFFNIQPAPMQTYNPYNEYYMATLSPFLSAYKNTPNNVYHPLPPYYPPLSSNYVQPNQVYPQGLNVSYQPHLLSGPLPQNINYNYNNYNLPKEYTSHFIQQKSEMPLNYVTPSPNMTNPSVSNQQAMRMPFTPNMSTALPVKQQQQYMSTTLPVKQQQQYMSTTLPVKQQQQYMSNSLPIHRDNTKHINTYVLPNACPKPSSQKQPNYIGVNISPPLPTAMYDMGNESNLPTSLNLTPKENANLHLPPPVPKLSPTQVDVAKIDLPSVEVATVNLPSVEAAKSEPPSVEVDKINPTSIEVAGLQLPPSTVELTQDIGKLSEPIGVSSIESKMSRHKTENSSDEYLSATESVEDNEICPVNETVVVQSPLEKIENTCDESIPDCWEDLDSQPLKANNIENDFKVPLDMLIGDIIGTGNSFKIENFDKDSSSEKLPPRNWSEIYPDILNNKCNRLNESLVIKTSSAVEEIALIKDSLVHRIEIDTIRFHMVYVHKKLAVLPKELYPQLINLNMRSLEKILETNRPFTMLTKADEPALFAALEKVEFCGGVDKKTVIRLGKIVAISFLEDVPHQLTVLNFTKKVFLDRIKEISSEFNSS